jgi:probable rRNA maturation factor
VPLELTDPERLLVDRSARARLKKAGQILLDETGKGGAELSLVLIGDHEMRRLNLEYRGIEKTTDVLSFSQSEGTELAALDAAHLGDVVISVPVARRQARAGGWTVEEEMARLLVHGFLHLLGYDHETGRREAVRMFAEEKRLLAALAAHGVSCARRDPP